MTVKESRLDRGWKLYEEHGHEILEKHSGGFSVPGNGGAVYTVRGHYCSCPDFRKSEQICKHVFAVGYLQAKTAPCEGCLERFAHKDLYEVYGSLTYMDGDLVCDECAHGCDWEELR
jgi:hypothetical protein